MNFQQLLAKLLLSEWQGTEHNNLAYGVAKFEQQEFALAAIINTAALDNAMSLTLAEFILAEAERPALRPLLILVDTAGQQATRFAELIGLNRYFGHLATCLHWSRAQGLRVFGLIYGKALGGALIASGLNAERIYALESAEIAVMWLEAMSRVTKIPLARLQELSRSSPIFAPGAENFVKLGAVSAVIPCEKFMPQICLDLSSAAPAVTSWQESGFERGGRKLARQVLATLEHCE